MFYSILIWMCGFLVGVASYKLIQRRLLTGKVKRIIDPDTGEVYLFAELYRPISDVFKKQYVVFRVDQTVESRK